MKRTVTPKPVHCRYLNAMKKFNKDNDAQLLMYLARAYFRTGKLTECREALERVRSGF